MLKIQRRFLLKKIFKKHYVNILDLMASRATRKRSYSTCWQGTIPL